MPNGVGFSLYLPKDLMNAIEDIEIERNSRKIKPRSTRASIIREAVSMFVAAQKNENRYNEETR